MRIMSFLVALVMTVSLSTPAFAQTTASLAAANELNKLGLFNGVGTNADNSVNYSLSTQPTRAQALVMIIGLGGQKEAAQSGSYPHNFNDLSDGNAWALPFVSYGYYMGITHGVSSTRFGTNDSISEYDFVFMVLKMLGYDAVYANTYELASSLGLHYTGDSEFTRGDMALVCRSALDCNIASGGTLLSYLNSIGLFDSLVGGTETAPPSTVAPTIIPMITEITASTPADGADQFVKVVASGAVNVDIRTSNGAESSVKDAINDQINRYVQVSEIKFKWSPGSGTLSAEIVYHDSDEIIFYLQGKRDTLSSDNQQTLFAAQTMYYQYVSSASTDLDKVKAIHDTIINNTTYEYTGSRSHTAAAVFVDGKAVCDGYAKAFNLLSYMAGISSMRITGYAGEDHAWNLVNVMGTWYHIDVTWDDPISTRPVLRYDYFLISDSKISADHSWTKYSEIPSCPENYYTDYASMVS